MFQIEVLSDDYVVCQLDPAEGVPQWPQGEFVSVTRTADEVSIVCCAKGIPAGVRCERGWRCLRMSGKLDFGLLGVLARITTLLSDAQVSVLAISTFDTDYFLVRKGDLECAVSALAGGGVEMLQE